LPPAQVLHDLPCEPPLVEKHEYFRVTLVAEQDGQAGVSSPWTSSSKWRSQFMQTYS
jgi:hypothetical protein